MYDSEFIDWFKNESQVKIPGDQDLINICRECMKNYDKRSQKDQNESNKSNESIETVDLTIKDPSDCLSVAGSSESSDLPDLSEVEFGSMKEPELEISNTKKSESGIIKDSKSEFINVKELNTIFITLVCYDRQWGKIELGRICYQVSSTSKADHYDLKADGAITAYLAGLKNRKNIQLCALDTESSTINKLNDIKKKIYENLPSCNIHIQGCLISEDGRHLKLDNEILTLWARAILMEMPNVNEKTPPNIPSFDKTKYQYPISKRPLNTNNNKLN
ncbi:hypothetical protein C2G38_2225517 [Gigaspora rosea]|uniref:Uncharacterized protein n=1 Tax=Gigaspora rosea TaxID=44941 RepID=A0A397U2C5_9GLOM|nr:hypothetical protein C2G38_2225517 [Gigaspora rosea]